MSAYWFWIVVFAYFVYICATDDSVLYAIQLVSKIVKFQYEKIKWWIWNNPANPIVKFFMWRRALRLAKELEKELKK